jgi:tetratricopeptide (TPR) repeat protein
MSAALLGLLLVLAAAGGSTNVPAAATDDPGEAAWRQRAAGFDASGTVSPEPVERAIAAWEAALARRPDDLALRFRLIEAHYFAGHFAARDAADSRRAADRALALAEETFDRIVVPLGGAAHLASLTVAREAELERDLPEAAAGHFWCAISWGVWGMTHSKLQAARRDVAGRIRRHAEVLIELDPAYADGGGFRLLGRLHAATPKVPLVTGWIDRRLGIEHLRRALATSTRDARNPVFLAEALLAHAPERRPEAIALLREVAARTPDPASLVEESETLDRARALLEREVGR